MRKTVLDLGSTSLYDKEEKIIGKFMNGWFDQ